LTMPAPVATPTLLQSVSAARRVSDEGAKSARFSSSSAEAGDTFPGPPPEEPWMVLRRRPLPPKQSDDNYEISDADESENEDQARERRKKKFVPTWTKKYVEELNRQADIDPDTIFGNRVPHCCLEDIFTDAVYKQAGKGRPRRRRGSSGNWSRDKLTRPEVENYKQRIGQQRGWVEANLCQD